MSQLYQLYAFVTNAHWQANLTDKWPDAPLVGGYRVLVFTNADYQILKQQYSQFEAKELDADEIISGMEAGEIGAFICEIESLKVVMNHFSPPDNSGE